MDGWMMRARARSTTTVRDDERSFDDVDGRRDVCDAS